MSPLNTASERPDEETVGPRVEVPPKIAALLRQFRRDLPSLLAEHQGEWVAYYGGDEMRFARTQRELLNAGIARGLAEDEFIVCCVMPPPPKVIDAYEWCDV